MNILEAFDLSLPEMPALRAAKSHPRLEPRLVAREQIEAGKAVVLAHLPGGLGLYRISPQEWRVFQLMDGQRSLSEIAEACQAAGDGCTEEDVRNLVERARESELIYKSPAERNVILKEKIGGQRRKIRKLRFGDLSEVEVAHWDPDQFLTRLYPWVKFIYAPWFVLSTLVGFCVMIFLWIDRWGELWSDSLAFFNYFNKGLADLVEFYLLFGIMVFLHESAHGMTCKHFGGGVHRMGFMLMYLMPAFYCDVTEVCVYAGRWSRIATAAAGVWIDLVLCVPATLIWWATPTGMPTHDFAYKIMLLTGIAISLMQLNPLMKLDGYFILCDLIEMGDLMETSTAYFDSWIERRLFRLPVAIEAIPRRRRVTYFTYALVAKLYGLVLLTFFVLFAYNILRSYSAEWAFIPATLLGYLIFRSRISGLIRLLRASFLDHRAQLKKHFVLRLVPAAALVLAALFLPIWRETVEARLILQSTRRAVIRAEVAGYVEQVRVREGQRVGAGELLARLSNLDLESEAAELAARLELVSARTTQSQLQYREATSELRERQQLSDQNQIIGDEIKRLQVVSPIAGVVLTARLQDLVGRFLPAGTEIAQIADISAVEARAFVPEFSMHDVRVGAPVRLLFPGALRSRAGTVISISPETSPVPPSLVEKSEYQGIRPPQYYLAIVSFTPAGSLREGLTGRARIFVRRRSLAGMSWVWLRDMVAHRFW